MAIPADELLQEDFDFPINEANLDQVRMLQNRFPFLGAQRSIYGGGAIGSGGLNLAGYTPQYSSMVGPIATGQAYAQSIAGGMPFSQVVAPGMSFSPEQPMGYTQADLNVVNLPTDVAPVFSTPPATTGQVAQPSYPTMPYAPTGTPMPTIFGIQAPQLPPIDLSQIQLPEIDLSQITIPESVKSSLGELLGIPKIDVSQFVTREEVPSFIPPVQIPQIPQIDTSQFIGRQELPNILAGLPQAPQVDVSRFIGREELPSLLKDIPLNIPKIDTSQFVSREDISGLRSDILGSLPQIKMPDTSQFLTQQDISGLRSDILGSIPQVQLPDVSQFATQADINKALAALPPVEQLDRQAIIRDIESQLKIPERFDPTALQQQIGGLQQQIAGLPQPQQIDVGALRQDILSRVPQFDPSGLQQGIASLQSRIENIPQVAPRSDAEIQALINRSMQNIPQPVSYDNRIADLERRISELSMPSASPVQGLPAGRFNFGR